MERKTCAVSCEHSNEPSNSIKRRQFIDYLTDYYLLKNSYPWSSLKYSRVKINFYEVPIIAQDIWFHNKLNHTMKSNHLVLLQWFTSRLSVLYFPLHLCPFSCRSISTVYITSGTPRGTENTWVWARALPTSVQVFILYGKELLYWIEVNKGAGKDVSSFQERFTE